MKRTMIICLALLSAIGFFHTGAAGASDVTLSGPLNGQYSNPPGAIVADGSSWVGSTADVTLVAEKFTLNPGFHVEAGGALAARRSNGTLRWTYATGYTMSDPAVGADGTVYIISMENGLYGVSAINPSSGVQNWWYAVSDHYVTAPSLGPDGAIFVHSNPTLYALNPNGTLRWSYYTGSSSGSPPAVRSVGQSYNVYLGSYDDTITAVSSTGALVWQTSIGNDVPTSPSIGLDGTVYGVPSPYICALNSSGVQQWQYQTGGSVYFSPAIASDGTLYVISDDQYLYALNSDGSLKWRKLISSITKRPVTTGTDGTIYVSYFDSTIGAGDRLWSLMAINSDGTDRWTFKTGHQNLNTSTANSPAIGADGTVYFTENAGGGTNTNGYLHAVKSDGTLKWSYQTGASGTNAASISSPVIGPDGAIYFTFSDGNLYAVTISTTGFADSTWPMLMRDPGHTGCMR